MNMDRDFNKRWSDFSGRYGSQYCSFCKRQMLDFEKPKHGSVVGIDVVAVTCSNCGHIELFDVAEVYRIADEIDKDYHDKGWR